MDCRLERAFYSPIKIPTLWILYPSVLKIGLKKEGNLTNTATF
jgi:hypothetical protein